MRDETDVFRGVSGHIRCEESIHIAVLFIVIDFQAQLLQLICQERRQITLLVSGRVLTLCAALLV